MRRSLIVLPLVSIFETASCSSDTSNFNSELSVKQGDVEVALNEGLPERGV